MQGEKRKAIMLDEDIHAELKVLSARKRVPMKQLINELFNFYVNNEGSVEKR